MALISVFFTLIIKHCLCYSQAWHKTHATLALGLSDYSMCYCNHCVKLDNKKLQHLLKFITDLQTKVKKKI